jgi:hypothetical protein
MVEQTKTMIPVKIDDNKVLSVPVWTNVNDALPDKTGFYLVYAPSYFGGSSSGLENIDGVMFSKFTITKSGKKSWSIEVGYHKRPNCVKYWMMIPPRPTT